MTNHHTNFKIRTIVPFSRKLTYPEPQISNSSRNSIRGIIDELNFEGEKKLKCSGESSLTPSEAKLKMEDSNEGLKKNKYTVRSATWLGLKGFIFVACVTCFLYQSVQFYMRYKTYPIKTSIKIELPKLFMKPAVTFCDRNPIPRREFCGSYPHLCDKPNDLTKFCQNEPHFCQGNVSDLMIPKFGYFTQDKHEEVQKLAWKILLNSSGDHWSLFQEGNPFEKITFVYDGTLKTIVKCYSENIHINGETEPVIGEIHPFEAVHHVNQFILNIEKEELFYPWLTHQVFFAIHSPFDPINPLQDGRAMKPGYHYKVNIRLEEERFLPYPYETNCTDYEAIWKKNNKTGPRSQNMCRHMCGKIFYNILYKCEQSLTMFENIEDICCPKEICGHYAGLGHGLGIQLKNREECSSNCKEECLKLKYVSTIEESTYEPDKERAIGWTSGKKELTVVSVTIRDIEKTVVLHDPLYSIENLFSNIGGLMGCWLGISVWAFVNIIEKTNLMFTNCMKKFKMKEKKITDDTLFFPTHLKLHHK